MLLRILFINYSLLISLICFTQTIFVKNIEELNAANKKAQPGDTIILENGEWNNVTFSLSCHGKKELPITFKSQTPGKVLITGNSKLLLGGSFIIIDGFYFSKGHSVDDPVIKFCIDKAQLANNCRVTNTVINDFNNPKRLQENYWVAFYGKNNRLDHCSFLNKKNIGVLVAVILDDERSRENFHSIDHNYFGLRLPLASNAGEIIRVGVSQHCQFNSNTKIANNFFEHCDGETEVISIKSGRNSIEKNIFKECQGSVVLRHGDNNLVADNYFLGYNKPGSGGVRVINKGQKVIRNIFYKCIGVDFRSPLAIMNGIPNSPANRYVQVTDAEIADNTFYECAPVTFCEGSDSERTLAPDKVIFSGNTFYSRDSIIYKIYDDMKGFRFGSNRVSQNIKQKLMAGFEKSNLPKQHFLTKKEGASPEYPHVTNIILAEKETYLASGATWFPKKNAAHPTTPLNVTCSTAEEVFKQLERKEPVNIKLTGKEYFINRPFIITKAVQFTGDKKNLIKFTTGKMQSVFIIDGNGNLVLKNLSIYGGNVKASHFISNDSGGKSNHYNLSIRHCNIQGFNNATGCSDFFYGYKYMVSDSIILINNNFTNNNCNGIMMAEEKDNKGYYNAEKILISQNNFSSQVGVLLNIYRGGNDESTMGPLLIFSNNKLTDCTTDNKETLLRIHGVQRSIIEKNNFINCNNNKKLLLYEDAVRARHLFNTNLISRSGQIVTNKYVQSINNSINE